MVPENHRKAIRHFDLPGNAHELTFSCNQRWPLLDDSRRMGIFSHAVGQAMVTHSFQLLAFVWMPEHVHLLVYSKHSSSSIANLLFAIKRPSSFRFKKRLEETNDPLLDKLIVRERPGKMSFRFWQEGPGYDRNITSSDHLNDCISYIHANPVRRGFCASPSEYRWSSYRQYFEPESPLDLNLPVIERVSPA